MAAYNATLIQDAGEMLAYLDPYLWPILEKFPPSTYRCAKEVYEWLIREEIECVYGLNVIDHRSRLDPHRKIRNKLNRALPVHLEILIPAHIKVPRLYDNPFVQVDLMQGTDLYIQYYQHGMQSALKF